MKKIKTLFVRDWEGDPSFVTKRLEVGMERVLRNECVPTRKLDGTCTMVENGRLYKRYDRKRSKNGRWKDEPPGWIDCEKDERTGHWLGWIPVDYNKPENWMHKEAVLKVIKDAGECIECITILDKYPIPLKDGTYELVGPKVNGNPEKQHDYFLIRHGSVPLVEPFAFSENVTPGKAYDELEAYLNEKDIEGIVWWDVWWDGANPKHFLPVAKIKLSDFGLARGLKNATRVKITDYKEAYEDLLNRYNTSKYENVELMQEIQELHHVMVADEISRYLQDITTGHPYDPLYTLLDEWKSGECKPTNIQVGLLMKLLDENKKIIEIISNDLFITDEDADCIHFGMKPLKWKVLDDILNEKLKWKESSEKIKRK